MRKIAAIKKGTKRTDNPKDYMLRVRMDKSTLEKLDCICDIEHKNRYEIIRDSIDDLYRKKIKTLYQNE